MKRENRAPTTMWGLRREPGNGYVRTIADDLLQLALPHDPESLELIGIVLSRKDAWLLAKRIHQCLDETRL